MKFKIFPPVLLIIIICSLCFSENESEEEVIDKTEAYRFVNKVYSNYNNKDSIFNFKGPEAEKIFCPELLKLIQLDKKLAQGEVGYLEEDPLCQCQDDGGLIVKSIIIKELSCDTIAQVELNFPVKLVKIHLKIKKINERWCIEDISSEGSASIYKFLFENLMEDVLKEE